MSEITNAEINKKAAEMVGHKLRETKESTVVIISGDEVLPLRYFDIFATSPQGSADREAVEDALYKKDIFIAPALYNHGYGRCGKYIQGYTVFKLYEQFTDCSEYDTKLEAYSAAVQAVK